MSEVKRGKGRSGAGSGRRAPARPANARVSNWALAQLRAARYRAAHAMRLAGIAVAVLGVGVIGLIAAAGRLDDINAAIWRGAETRLASAGFTVAAVDVAGGERVTAREIAGLLDLSEDTPITAVDPQRARETLLQLSWVEDAAVARLWPDRLSIVIREREPFALWQIDGVHHVIDARGVVIEAADARDFAELPRVVGLGANDHAGAIWAMLDQHEAVRRLVTDAVRVGERRWNLRLVHGVDVMLPEEDPAAALTLLARFHEDQGLLNINAERIDIRSDGQLVLRARPDRAAAGRGA